VKLKVKVFFPGAGDWTDVTHLVRHGSKAISRRLMNDDRKSVVDSFRLQLKHDNDLVNGFFVYEGRIILAQVSREDDTPEFTGYVAPTYRQTAGEVVEALDLELLDNSYLLDEKIATSFQYPSAIGGTPLKVFDKADAAHSIVHLLLDMAGYPVPDIVSASAPNVTDTVLHVAATAEDETYRDFLDDLLFEHGYVMDWDAAGKFTVYRWDPDSFTPTLTIAENFGTAEGLTRTRRDINYDGVRLEWADPTVIDGALLYRADLPLSTTAGEVQFTGVDIGAGDYYPPDGDIQELFQDFVTKWLDIPYLQRLTRLQNKDISLITTSDQVVAITAEAGVAVDSQVFESHRARVLIKNSAGSTKKLYTFEITGKALYRKTRMYAKSPDTAKLPKPYTSRHIFDATRATRQAQAMWTAIRYGAYDYSWSMRGSEYPVGTVTQISLSNPVLSTKAIIIGLERNYDMPMIRYAAVGVEGHQSTTTVQSGGTSGDLVATQAQIEAALSVVPSFVDLQAGYVEGGGTKTPTTPALVAYGLYRAVNLKCTRQLNLTNFDRYEFQVSPDGGATGYALDFNGSGYSGPAGEDTDWPVEGLVHTMIPFGGTADAPTGKTYHYRVRTVTTASLASAWSAWLSATTITIGPGDLALDSVTAAKIAAGAVGTPELAALAVTTAKIAADAVTAAEIAAGAVGTTELAALAVTEAKIAALAVTTAKIAADAVTDGQLAAEAVSGTKIEQEVLRRVAPAGAGYGLLMNPSFAVTDLFDTDRPLGWRLVEGEAGVAESSITRASVDNRLVLQIGGTAGIAAGSAMIGVRDTDTFRVRIRLRGSASTASGLYLRMNYLTANVPNAETTHIGVWSYPWQIIRNGGLDFAQNAAWPLVWTEYEYTWTPPAGIRYVSLAIYKWAGAAAITGYVEQVIVERIIVTNDLFAEAVTAAKIAVGTITATQIAAETITAAEIAAATITGAKIAAGTITAGNIAALTITASELAAATITGAKIAAGTITAANIAALTITASELAAATITGAKIAAGTITAGNIAANTITAGEIAALAIGSDELAANSVIAGKIAAGAIQTTHLSAGSVDTNALGAGVVTAGKIAANTITANEIAITVLNALVAQIQSYLVISDTLGWCAGPTGAGALGDQRAYLDKNEIRLQYRDATAFQDRMKITATDATDNYAMTLASCPLILDSVRARTSAGLTIYEDGGTKGLTVLDTGLIELSDGMVTPTIRAASAAGLTLYEDGGTKGLRVLDSGYVTITDRLGINDAAPDWRIEAYGTFASYNYSDILAELRSDKHAILKLTPGGASSASIGLAAIGSAATASFEIIDYATSAWILNGTRRAGLYWNFAFDSDSTGRHGFLSSAAGNLHLLRNTYYDGAWKSLSGGYSSMAWVGYVDGQIFAVSGDFTSRSADTAVTMEDQFRISKISGATYFYLGGAAGGSDRNVYQYLASDAYWLWNESSTYLRFYMPGGLALTIDSSGGVEAGGSLAGGGLLITGGDSRIHTGTGTLGSPLYQNGDGAVIIRNTSSRRYKTDIRNLQDDLVLRLRPVGFRSTCKDDPKDMEFYGLVAEEVAELGYPGLIVTTEIDGRSVPDGVQYSALIPFLVARAQDQETRIKALEGKL
jgi:hypothetical protein